MRRLFITFILFGVLTLNSFAGKMPEPEMNMMSVLNECKVAEKATDDDVKGFLSHKIPQNRAGKCLMACAFEKNGDIKNGKINVEGIKASLGNTPGSKAFTDDMVTECQAIENPDRCELAVQFTECMMSAVAKSGPPKN